MNSFDKIQCEETPDAQLYFSMEEQAIIEKWEEEQERKAQQELDKYADEWYSSEIDFWTIEHVPAGGMTAIGGDVFDLNPWPITT